MFRLFHRYFVGGVRIAIDASIQASVLAEDQLQTVLEAAIYQAHEIPSDYLPRYDIIIMVTTCISITCIVIPTKNGREKTCT